MPKYIIKLSGKGGDFYLEWSTVVDAPTTYGMSLEEFKKFYREEYGNHEMQDFPQRLEMVEKTGCSGYNETLDGLLSCNRAGDKEAEISKEEIFKKYYLEKPAE